MSAAFVVCAIKSLWNSSLSGNVLRCAFPLPPSLLPLRTLALSLSYFEFSTLWFMAGRHVTGSHNYFDVSWISTRTCARRQSLIVLCNNRKDRQYRWIDLENAAYYCRCFPREAVTVCCPLKRKPAAAVNIFRRYHLVSTITPRVALFDGKTVGLSVVSQTAETRKHRKIPTS